MTDNAVKPHTCSRYGDTLSNFGAIKKCEGQYEDAEYSFPRTLQSEVITTSWIRVFSRASNKDQ